MSEVYSWCGENLLDHLTLTHRLFVNCFQPSISRILERELEVKLDSDLAKLALELAPLLHDIGKAWNRYQVRINTNCPFRGERCRRCISEGRGPSFKWHEVLSAHIALRLLEAMSDLDVKVRPLGSLTCLAILMHHQAMRSPWDSSKLTWTLEGWNPLDVAPLLSRLIPEVPEKTRLIEDSLRRCSEDVEGATMRTLVEIVNGLTREWLPGQGKRKLYTVVAGPLVLCDWIAARHLRGSEMSHPMLSEALNAIPELQLVLRGLER